MKSISTTYTTGYQVHKGAVITSLLLLLSMLLPLTLMAQQGKGKGAMADSAHHEPFMMKTIETVRGTVTRIDQLPGRREGMVGIHAMLKTDDETIEVHLGPYSYISKQDLQLKEGDTIEVTGSRVTNDNKPAILATEVKRGDEVLALRDEQGKPLWRGQGNHKGQ